jgi:hypothetical protein
MFEKIPPSDERLEFSSELDHNKIVFKAETIIINSQYRMRLPGNQLKTAVLKLGHYMLESTKTYGYIICGISLTTIQIPKEKFE